MQAPDRRVAQSDLAAVPVQQTRTWASSPGSSSVRRTNRLAVVALLVALAAVTALVPTVKTAISLRSELSALQIRAAELRSEFRASIAAADERLTQSVESASGEINDLRESLQAQVLAEFDSEAIVTVIEDAVFTIESGGAQGSGFGLSTYGGATWIATNYHVIEDSTYIGGPPVTVRQGAATWTGKAWNWDRGADVATVKVNATLPILESAFSAGHAPSVGESVLAYGSPLGLEGTATVGIVSAIRGGYIQTDAQINHGNSGGPLVNAYGDVLGLTTLGYGDGSGIGFAVDIRTLCDRLMRDSC